MTNKTAYLIDRDRISSDADLFADLDELRAYLAECHEEAPGAGWDRIIDTLEVREGTVYADVGDGPVEVAHEVRTTTIDEALADASREDIAATVEELEALSPLRRPVTIESTDPDWPQLIVVDPYMRQPTNASWALAEARAYLKPWEYRSARHEQELLSWISDATAFDAGEEFESEEEVREYFSPAEQRFMGGEDAVTDEELLSEWADAVIEHRWHCKF